MTQSTISIARTVSTTPESVFDAWTEAGRLATWWWPQLAGTTYAVDARAGGSYAITSPVLGVTVRGVYSVVDRPHRLQFTWNWDDGEPEAVIEDTVVVTFEPRDRGAVVTVEHTSVAHEPDGGT